MGCNNNSPDPSRNSENEEIDEDDFVFGGDIEEVIELDEAESDDIHLSDSEEPPLDDSQLVYDLHSKSVFCGSLHPNGRIAISGGEDDKAYVWSIETGETLFECNEHSDSIIVASFSFDGAFLATADMAGFIRVRRCPNGSDAPWNIVWEYQAGDLSWGFWHTAAHVLVCSVTSGEVFLWKIPSGDTKVLQSHGKQSSCGVLLKDGKRLAVGYDDGCVKIWDLKNATVMHTITFDNPNSSSINAIDSFHDNNLIIAGCMDGTVAVIKSSTGKSIGTFNVDSTVEAIKFSRDPSLGLVGIGTLEGTISIWDVSRQTVRHKCASNEDEEHCGISSLLWIDNYLLAAGLNGCVRIFESKSGNLYKTLVGHRAEILDIAYSMDTDVLLTTSEDSTCRIFKLDLPKV